MASKIEPLLTVADLDALPDDNNRYELIEGELFVSRAPGLSHQRIILNILKFLLFYLERNPVGRLVPGPGAIFSDYDAVIPDIAFVRNERWDEVVTGEKFTGALDLIIEVVSPGTENRRRDFTAKRQLYGKYGIEEYWIIDPENRELLVYRNDNQTLHEAAKLTGSDEITSALLPGFQLHINEIFIL